MATEPTRMTDTAVVKLINELCAEHGRVRVMREETDKGIVITIETRWADQPVRCLLQAKHKTAA